MYWCSVLLPLYVKNDDVLPPDYLLTTMNVILHRDPTGTDGFHQQSRLEIGEKIQIEMT
jgi:hypothetical protein